MKADGKILFRALAFWGALAFLTPAASAATRTVYFSQTGMNKTTHGLSAPATSTCKITISNPSTAVQTFTLTTRVTSLNGWTGAVGTQTLGAYAGAATDFKTSAATLSCAAFVCTGRLTANDSIQVTYNFTAYPASTTPAAQNSTQKLRCSGTIVAVDEAQPGFLIASAVLVTFLESARMTSESTTGGVAGNFGGLAVFSQVPISVNRAKPF